MSLTPGTAARLEVLRGRGCEVGEPRADAGGWAFRIDVPGGEDTTGRGADAEAAASAAAARAERLIDIVQEASEESFPASDPPAR